MDSILQLHSPTITSYRDYVTKDFSEVKQQMDNEVPKCKRKGPRGGVVMPFPVRLYNMLQSAGAENSELIVSWQPHGRAFIVRDAREFARSIMPRFFHQTKLTSFHRQLNLYGFRRLTKEPDCGAYYHDLFLRGRPELCTFIVRIRSKGYRQEEPNLYSFPICGLQHGMVSSNLATGKGMYQMNKEPAGYHPEVVHKGLNESVLQSYMSNGEVQHTSAGVDVDIISDNDLCQVLDGWSDETYRFNCCDAMIGDRKLLASGDTLSKKPSVKSVNERKLSWCDKAYVHLYVDRAAVSAVVAVGRELGYIV